VFRPHNVYGEFQNIADRYRNVVGIFMNQTLRGEPLSVFGDGLQTRAFSYVDDVAPIIARAPLVPAAYGEVFNIGADRPCTVLELAHEIALAFRGRAQLATTSIRATRWCTPTAATTSCGVRSRICLRDPLAEGVRRMAEWVKRSAAAGRSNSRTSR
jgi:UDP-glucose 4-epimerase